MSEKDTLYARWLSGELSEGEMKELKASGELDELRAIINHVDSWTLPKFDQEVALEQIIKKPKSSENNPKIVRLVWGTAAAASIFLALSIFTLLRMSLPTEVSAPYAMNEIYELPDGAIVEMNDGSSIRFEKRTWDEARNIDLKGEASFDVPKGSPFIVTTDNGTVEVLGTSFNVRSWGDDLIVECYSGKVRVSRLGISEIIEEDQGVKIKNTGKSSRFSVETSDPLWRSGTSKFVEENIENVFQEMIRQFDIEINHPSSNRLFTGSFDHNDLNEALTQICIPMGLKYTIDEPNKSVTITEK